jgi:hypothetical protein
MSQVKWKLVQGHWFELDRSSSDGDTNDSFLPNYLPWNESQNFTKLYYIPQYKLFPNRDPGIKNGMIMIWEQKCSSFETGRKIASSF